MKMIVVRQLMFNLFSSGVARKTLVAFVFLCMLVNGFTPRSEEGRNSFVVVMACAMQNAVSEIFVSCNEALTSISNKITKDIYALLLAKDVKTSAPVNNEEKKSPDPVNTTSDSGIMSERRQDIKTWSDKTEDSKGYISFIMTGKLYKLYENIKVSS
ncbi:MAG: hypothetical protein PHI20_05615, partial [Endomicrobiaceae bacterium]|nr:hypothetical protein [Endomicrobiaceae bacterium]MDD3730493.1 hypothetical protein [Endomicrobiaceae bacterium]MDD4166242.1 hypothetical protein [Endomicrobiaceae bacterium]